MKRSLFLALTGSVFALNIFLPSEGFTAPSQSQRPTIRPIQKRSVPSTSSAPTVPDKTLGENPRNVDESRELKASDQIAAMSKGQSITQKVTGYFPSRVDDNGRLLAPQPSTAILFFSPSGQEVRVIYNERGEVTSFFEVPSSSGSRWEASAEDGNSQFLIDESGNSRREVEDNSGTRFFEDNNTYRSQESGAGSPDVGIGFES